ncbi:RnaseH-domain-containing protein [Infundibulicybe gibba]|nr:RnaseH-domain-containing protein [Infundibulicybe gibba]
MHPAEQRTNLQDRIIRTTTIYTDGSCINNGDENAQAGSGVWYAPEDARNRAHRLPKTIQQSNNAGEAAAVLIAVQNKDENTNLLIKTDSLLILEGLTKNLQSWEDRGWIGTANQALMRATASVLRSRKGQTLFQKVKGHSGDVGNDGADAEAAIGARKTTEDQLDLTIPDEWNLTGAKLTTMTQSLLYKGIGEYNKNATKQRRATNINLERIRCTIKDTWDFLPTDNKIWASQRRKEISKNVRAYLWKATDGAYRCGSYWNNIPGYEQRAICPICMVEESMEHILTDCRASGQKTLWALAKVVWENKGHKWPKPEFGTLLGCGLAAFTNDGKRDQGANRLFVILISKTTHLIWKTRCEWRIGREEDRDRLHTQSELENKWKHTINRRLKLDCLIADARRYGSKATPHHTVCNTWKRVLLNEGNLPENWVIYNHGVLVGTEVRPPGRNR